MRIHLKYSEIPGIKIGGIILDVEKGKWFNVGRRYKSREPSKLEKIPPRIQKIKNGEYNFFNPIGVNAYVNLMYLNMESAQGLYKDQENNLPYEIISQFGELVYRQSIKETKKEIFDKLEKLAIEEGLRK